MMLEAGSIVQLQLTDRSDDQTEQNRDSPCTPAGTFSPAQSPVLREYHTLTHAH